MDLNTNRKIFEGNNGCSIGQAEDKISELPDSLLHYILSLLDIKHVVRTCILSKRWKQIWASIPALDLQFREREDPPSLPEINKFMDFVDRTLLLHDTSSNIQKFKLKLYNNMNASRVNSWIEHITRRNVEELSLHSDLDQEIPLSIPLSLFTCETLTKLEIIAGPSINFPKNLFFPKLKSLKLWRIQFGDSCWNEEPFSHCLVLEELFLRNCTWFGMRTFCILTPLLKVLEINKLRDEKGLADCDFKIHAPGLVSLSYLGCVAKDYQMSSLLSLDKAVVVFDCFDYESGRVEQWISQAVSKFLWALSHVKCLSLYFQTPQVLSIADRFLMNPPTYHNLNSLDLLHGATTDNLVFAFLKAAPNLRRLGFSLIYDSSSVGETVYDGDEDLFRHLQSVYYCYFSGKTRELRWAELILKKAKYLQSMVIAYRAPRSNAGMLKSKEVVMSELLSFTRASSRCKVQFLDQS